MTVNNDPTKSTVLPTSSDPKLNPTTALAATEVLAQTTLAASTPPPTPAPAPTPTPTQAATSGTGNTGNLTAAQEEELQPLITSIITGLTGAGGTTYTQESATAKAKTMVANLSGAQILKQLNSKNAAVYSMYQTVLAASKPGATPLTAAQVTAMINTCTTAINNPKNTPAQKLPYEQMLAQLKILQTNLNNNVAGATGTAAEAMSHLGCILQSQAIITLVQNYMIIKIAQGLLSSNTPTATASTPKNSP